MSNAHTPGSEPLPDLVAQASRLCLPALPSSSPSAPPTDADAIDLVRSLVEIPSISGDEAGVARTIAAWCAARDIPCHIDAVGNALATFGPPDAPRTIMLLGHMDTFPGMPPVRIEHGVLHGRGSVDAKGPLAAFLIAAARAAPALAALRTRVIVAGAVEEETTTSRGARHIAATHTPDACIIGEPSGTSGYTLGYKGRLVLWLRVERGGSHSAGPDASAADEALAWWQRALNVVANLNAAHAGERPGAFDSLNTSKWTANAALFYDTPTFSSRIAFNYRSSYRGGIWYPNPAYSWYQDDTYRLDAAVNYTPVKFLTLSVEGGNLLGNDVYRYFGQQNLLPLGVRLQARTVQASARFRF